jgi:uncharacterized protein
MVSVKILRFVVAVALSAQFGVAAAQPQIPSPRGYVNDFAGVIGAARADSIARIIQFVREQSGGEIAVVTLRDLGGRDVNDVALRIGREWGVGLEAEVGNRARNAGVVILVVPKETSSDNRGHVAIQVGQGAEGFIPDGAAGSIWREAISLLQRADYGGAVHLMTYRVASRYAGEFGFSLDSAGVSAPSVQGGQRTRGSPSGAVLVFIMGMLLFGGIVMIAAARAQYRGGGRRGAGFWTWLALAQAAQHRQSRRSSGWNGGFGGFGGGGFGGFGGGGGGFGGFGGGGGFSGGGSGGSW